MTPRHPALLFVLLLGGCSGRDDSDSTGAANGNQTELDPCVLVTEADASALFGEPAVPNQDAVTVTDPAFIGDCSWTFEPKGQLGSQLLAFYLWDGEDYYAPAPGDAAFEIGDEGSVAMSGAAGVDVSWRQYGVTAILSYFTVGAGVPDHLAKVDEVKALALEVSSRF
jgi:hypothetical protein